MNYIEEIIRYSPCNEQEKKDKEIILKNTELFQDILFRTNEFAHMTASSWIVNQDFSKVLMVYHNIFQAWSWTGGHADGDSNLLAVAQREAKEETGLHDITQLKDGIFSLEILGVDGHRKKDQYVASHMHLNLTYLFSANEDEETTVKADENSGVRWFELRESVSLCSEPYMKKIYQKLNEKLKQYRK